MNEPVCKVTVLTPRSSPTARVARRACGHARLEASRPCTAPLCNQLRQRDILQWQTWKQKAPWEAAAHRSVPAGQRHTPLQGLVQLHLRLVTGWTLAIASLHAAGRNGLHKSSPRLSAPFHHSPSCRICPPGYGSHLATSLAWSGRAPVLPDRRQPGLQQALSLLQDQQG